MGGPKPLLVMDIHQGPTQLPQAGGPSLVSPIRVAVWEAVMVIVNKHAYFPVPESLGEQLK